MFSVLFSKVLINKQKTDRCNEILRLKAREKQIQREMLDRQIERERERKREREEREGAEGSTQKELYIFR